MLHWCLLSELLDRRRISFFLFFSCQLDWHRILTCHTQNMCQSLPGDRQRNACRFLSRTLTLFINGFHVMRTYIIYQSFHLCFSVSCFFGQISSRGVFIYNFIQRHMHIIKSTHFTSQVCDLALYLANRIRYFVALKHF